MIAVKPLPNLFDHATRELSQDAFLCWLLHWADPAFAECNLDVHRCGQAALAAFYAAANRSVPTDVQEVVIHRQDQNIDIWAEIQTESERYAVLIEDKTGSGVHSDQLARYRKIMAKKGYDDTHLICIFFKTFDQCDYANIQAEGFHLFDRTALLKCLQPFAAVDNAILHDFYHRMQSIEDAVESFRHLPIAQWEGQSWVGFYKALRQQVSAATWGWINNPAGGYWGCWWGFVPGAPYFQLRQHQAAFCIAVDADPVGQKQIKEGWQCKALKLGDKMGLPLQPPKHRLGRNMTIALVPGDYRQVDANGLLDLDATVTFLRRFDEFGRALGSQSDLP
jgi:hypothetical protein